MLIIVTGQPLHRGGVFLARWAHAGVFPAQEFQRPPNAQTIAAFGALYIRAFKKGCIARQNPSWREQPRNLPQKLTFLGYQMNRIAEKDQISMLNEPV